MIGQQLVEQSHHCHNTNEVTPKHMGQIDRNLLTTKPKNKRIAYKILGMCCINVSIILIFLGTLLSTWFNFNPVWINNHIPKKVWDEITYKFPNGNG